MSEVGADSGVSNASGSGTSVNKLTVGKEPPYCREGRKLNGRQVHASRKVAIPALTF